MRDEEFYEELRKRSNRLTPESVWQILGTVFTSAPSAFKAPVIALRSAASAGATTVAAVAATLDASAARYPRRARTLMPGRLIRTVIR